MCYRASLCFIALQTCCIRSYSSSCLFHNLFDKNLVTQKFNLQFARKLVFSILRIDPKFTVCACTKFVANGFDQTIDIINIFKVSLVFSSAREYNMFIYFVQVRFNHVLDKCLRIIAKINLSYLYWV